MITDILNDVLLAVEAGASIEQLVAKLITDGQQSGLLTPEQFNAFRARAEAAFANRRYQTDAEVAKEFPNPSA